MKRTISMVKVILGMLLVFSLFVGIAQANPPQDVKLQVVETDGASMLAVVITHPSDDPTMEFVKAVEIKVNGSPFATFTYNRQPAKKVFRYLYEVPLQSGFNIEVTVDSSSYGSKTAKLTVQ